MTPRKRQKRAKAARAWAVFARDGSMQTTNCGDPETWRLKIDADANSYPGLGDRISRVEIREVPRKRRKAGRKG